MDVAIVDDERICQEGIASLLRVFGAEHRCQLTPIFFDSAEAFLEAFACGQFPIIFMDIFMKGMDGITAATRLREVDKRCILIFLTSSQDFRMDALSVHAFEYITKPFSPERVFAVLQDAMAVLPPAAKYIEVISERRNLSIFLHDIASVLTDAHYLNINLLSGSTVRCRLTMPEFLRMTEGDPRFITVNKGIVLNADYVTLLEDNCCVMEDGARFPVRVRDRVQVEQAIREYHFAKIRRQQRHGQ